ncbi:hypothetical protein Q9R38_26010 [Priestia aryabhattai]|uniref:hypothetical protein n=1 Tax=Priestia aryabhattai TaxID=412384 RepID=UPI002882479F|nr:hypothetical protein [Priestia aryabhattai]MDT0149999.1 hypothetical protein [Priestia aryabhattai]MDT0155569.1 hypothetical protein [Priestia aryabhattai]
MQITSPIRNHIKVGMIELREEVIRTGYIKFSMLPSNMNPKSMWAEPFFYMKHEATDITTFNMAIANFVNTHGDDKKGYGVFFYIYKEEEQ